MTSQPQPRHDTVGPRVPAPFPFAPVPSLADPADLRYPCPDCGMVHVGELRECYPDVQIGNEHLS